MTTHETIRWPDEVDEILAGDIAVALASVTPAKGVVIAPLTNFGMRDREAGTISVNSSVAAWRKLDRIRRKPRVALAFHAREHGSSTRPEYVLAQGRATLSDPIPDYPSTIPREWSRMQDWEGMGRAWKWWLRIYALRIEIKLHVERLTVWPDLECSGRPVVQGAAPAAPPAAQRPPAKGTGPRINAGRAARRARRLPHVLLGWVEGDGTPTVVPVEAGDVTDAGIKLRPPAGVVPPGGRRAGLTAHWFAPRVVGQRQALHTGWLVADSLGENVVYAPHTSAAYRFPASDTVFHLVSGGGTRAWHRRARRAGIAPD